jgi:uncharacterized sulfatase
MISRLDRDVGRLLAKLEERGIAEKTLVLFSSDNGPHQEGGNDPERFDANGPLRGLKRALYEGGIRVPTVARWPGRTAPGSVSAHVGYFGDFFATFAELLGRPVPSGLDSLSLLPTLTGRPRDQKNHEYLCTGVLRAGRPRAVPSAPGRPCAAHEDGQCSCSTCRRTWARRTSCPEGLCRPGDEAHGRGVPTAWAVR